MWNLRQQRETDDPALVLQGENGTFRVISPSGSVEKYECEPGYSIRSIMHLEHQAPRATFLVEKIAEFAGPAVTPTGKSK
jgi:hypothetical protein